MTAQYFIFYSGPFLSVKPLSFTPCPQHSVSGFVIRRKKGVQNLPTQENVKSWHLLRVEDPETYLLFNLLINYKIILINILPLYPAVLFMLLPVVSPLPTQSWGQPW